jgi:hypothetical protein
VTFGAPSGVQRRDSSGGRYIFLSSAFVLRVPGCWGMDNNGLPSEVFPGNMSSAFILGCANGPLPRTFAAELGFSGTVYSEVVPAHAAKQGRERHLKPMEG